MPNQLISFDQIVTDANRVVSDWAKENGVSQEDATRMVREAIDRGFQLLMKKEAACSTLLG